MSNIINPKISLPPAVANYSHIIIPGTAAGISLLVLKVVAANRREAKKDVDYILKKIAIPGAAVTLACAATSVATNRMPLIDHAATIIFLGTCAATTITSIYSITCGK